ncbi:U3 snoRNA-associated protein UTP11 [Strigomonas culicis]|nr:U3 snoRNA-associated protein UTP11 [Strigomonas culicis]|eukprot:EPY22885.1 U3 snoRNA-associated protein UTP11 [Strigomonas culicis]
MTKAVMDLATGRMKQRKKGKSYDERQKDLKSALVHNNQNVQYLDFKAESDRHRAKELIEEDVSGALINAAPVNKHIIFAESPEEFKRFDPLKHFDTTAEMLRMHPLVRGKIEVMKNTVMPEELLLAGHHMKTASQKRTERKRIQNALRRAGEDTTEEARTSLVERMRHKMSKGLSQSDTVALADLVHQRAADDDEEAEEDEVAKDPLKQLQGLREEKERQDALVSARRVKEVAQRMERSKSLAALAKTIRRQNEGIKRQLTQRKESRYKPNVTRRAR